MLLQTQCVRHSYLNAHLELSCKWYRYRDWGSFCGRSLLRGGWGPALKCFSHSQRFAFYNRNIYHQFEAVHLHLKLVALVVMSLQTIFEVSGWHFLDIRLAHFRAILHSFIFHGSRSQIYCLQWWAYIDCGGTHNLITWVRCQSRHTICHLGGLDLSLQSLSIGRQGIVFPRWL